MIKITPLIATDLARFKKDLGGYDCNLNNPRSHNEHVMRKKYTDRNPLLTVTADKILCRSAVSERLENSGLTDYLNFIPIVYSGYDAQVASVRVEKNCVIKMNNASGRNIFVFDKFDRNAISRRLRDWMRRPYTNGIGEWCYEGIRPGIVIEKLIFKGPHIVYRFLCWGGEPHFIHAHGYDFGGGRWHPVACTTYDTDWRKQEVGYGPPYPAPDVPAPDTLSRMLEISRALSRPFDFVRVDLYSHQGEVYFSELTHYPVSGRCKFTPLKFDVELGELWR